MLIILVAFTLLIVSTGGNALRMAIALGSIFSIVYLFAGGKRKIEYNDDELVYRYNWWGTVKIKIEDVDSFEIETQSSTGTTPYDSATAQVVQYYLFKLKSGKKVYVQRILSADNETKLNEILGNKRIT